MKQLTITTILLVTSIIAFGQKNWEAKFNGYVKTRDDRTINGYLKFEVGFKDRGTKIKLYKNPKDSPQIFYSLEVKEYAHKKDTFKIFTNIKPSEDKKRILDIVEAKRICKGELELYEIPEYSYSAMIIPGMGIMATDYANFIYLVIDKEESVICINRETFKEKIIEIINDRQDLVDKVNSEELKFRHIDKIIEAYNKSGN